jgi:predicted DNA-binding transcriptional regulator AlpA
MIEYLNTRQAAARIGLKKNTLEGWRIKGEGPPWRKAGSRVLYLASEIEAWLASRTYRSTAEAKAAGGR